MEISTLHSVNRSKLNVGYWILDIHTSTSCFIEYFSGPDYCLAKNPVAKPRNLYVYTMSTPPVNPTPRPPRPPSRAPSPFLFLGVIAASTASFYYLTQRKQDDIRSGKAKVRRQMENPLVPSFHKVTDETELDKHIVAPEPAKRQV